MLANLLSPGSWRHGRRPPPQESGMSPRGSARGRQWRPAEYHDEDEEEEDEGECEDCDEHGDGFDDGQGDDDDDDEDEDDEDEDDEDEDDDEPPLLPLFSSGLLDKLPVYNLAHSIRLLVLPRCETTLSWDQLRSPQVSQFLVKPIQQAIRDSHFSRATLYALMANCLQFGKDAQMNPGTVGISRTRALICELLAMRLLKDYPTRELIDALSYDFDPLQGMQRAFDTPGRQTRAVRRPATARTSTIEVAIRAQSKKFLAHPLVVQQLEAIWAGNIVFHSAADYLHRPPARQPPVVGRGYGAIEQANKNSEAYGQVVRRTAALYDPAEASLFKLSRLRVPRYRQLFSTCSFAIMLGLFLAVLVQRSTELTALEIVFWFWSAGYMLDEIVGLTDEGFGLYIMSIWNAFDIGILLMFFTYYTLRLYGVAISTAHKHRTAELAYDVLASTAVLLFPRLFSVLDHYRYFSQLLIAFRMMALDLAAILILIIITCSGFFVAFTVAFPTNEDFTASKAAYTLFQIVMGFTPAAWNIWDSYNILGKGILTLFLCICHFLIVTILITVLTNSFMAVIANGNEEHQFLFAVNTIGMVKSDALFSYIAPTNVFGWMARPMMYVLPFRRYVRFNRTVIKITHFPFLWGIFIYERFVLTNRMYGPTDLVEQRGRSGGILPAFSLRGPTALVSPSVRLREPSVATFHKDRALDEVFRRPYREDTNRSKAATITSERKKTVVDDWMRDMGDDGPEEPPEQSRSVVDRLESRKSGLRRARMGGGRIQRRWPVLNKSVVSDPKDSRSDMIDPPRAIPEEDEADDEESGLDIEADSQAENLQSEEQSPSPWTVEQETEQEADATEGGPVKENRNSQQQQQQQQQQPDYFDPSNSSLRSSVGPRSRLHSGAIFPPLPADGAASPRPLLRHNSKSKQHHPSSLQWQREHFRTASSSTIVYSPLLEGQGEGEASDKASGTASQPPQARRPQTATPAHISFKPAQSKLSRTPISRSPERERTRSRSPAKQHGSGVTAYKNGGGTTPPGRTAGGAKRPLSSSHPSGGVVPPTSSATAPRPILPPRGLNQTTTKSNMAGFLALERDRDRESRKPSFNAMALDLASDLGDNVYRPDAGAGWTGMPASFSTQLEAAQLRGLIDRERRKQGGQGRGRALTRWNSNDVADGEDANEDDALDGDEVTEADSQHARRMGKIMLARMSTLEQGFKEVLDEVRGWRRHGMGGGTRRNWATAPESVESEGDMMVGLVGSSPRKRRKGKGRVGAGVNDGVVSVDFAGSNKTAAPKGDDGEIGVCSI